MKSRFSTFGSLSPRSTEALYSTKEATMSLSTVSRAKRAECYKALGALIAFTFGTFFSSG